MKKILFVAGCIALLSSAAQAQQKLPDNFFMKKLSNGLEILVIEDGAVPLVTVELCVKNGSYTESPEFNGLSHLYEHMFFKANKKYPSQKAYLDRVNELGVSFNGTTSNERVNYFITLGKDKLVEGIDFMNTAIRYPLFLKEEMVNENPVVAGEFQRNESNPFFALFDTVNHLMWGDLYSRKNVIGDYQIIYTASPEKMNVIKNKYYHPNNTLVAISGDVNHDQVFTEVEKLMGDWQAADFDPFVKFPIPEFAPLQYSTQAVVNSENAQVPAWMVNWFGPETRKDLQATYAADVFSYILGQKTSKFQQALVESGLAFNVGLSYQTCKYVGPVQVFLVPNPSKMKEAYETLWNQIAQFDNDDFFTDEQLQAAKDQLAVSEAYNREAPSQFVHTVTYWWSSASIDYYTNYVENLQKVTRDDIKNYVRRYIKGKPYVSALMLPNKLKDAGTEAFFAGSLPMDQYTLNFDADKVLIADKSENAAKMNSLLQWMKINPQATIKLSAFADAKEAKETGMKRYESILGILKAAGITDNRINGITNKAFQVTTLKSQDAAGQKGNQRVSFTLINQ